MSDNVEITKIVQVLQSGGVILYPTDTIWGLGCNALNETAVRKVCEIKQRDPDKSLILLADSQEMVENFVENIHPKAHSLMDYHQRPLTIIYNKAKNLPDFLPASDGSIAFRVVKDDFCRTLIRELGAPLVSTSANFSDKPSPENFFEIDPELIRPVDYVALHNRNNFEKRQPSTIVKITGKGELIFIRN